MKKNFIITVTNNIEGCPIEKYLETISANITTGFVSMDFWGRYSGSYKAKLDTLYEKAISEVKKKATNLGANAIIGFKVDYKNIGEFNNIEYLLITVSGTACIVKYPTKDIQYNNFNFISQESLDIELKKRLIIKSINEGESIHEEWRNFLCEYPQKEIVDKLLDIYVNKCFSAGDSEKEIISFIERYITLLSKEDILDKVYSKYQQNNKEIGSLIMNCNLFSPTHILAITEENIHHAINLLGARKDFYKREDLVTMTQILHVFDSLPNTGKIEMVKGGLLSKDQEKFICANGHKNNKDSVYCEYYSCGINIKGLTREEVKIIEDFRFLTNTLSDLLG